MGDRAEHAPLRFGSAAGNFWREPPYPHRVCAVCAGGLPCYRACLFDRVERGVELEYTTDGVQKGLALRAQIPLAKTLLDVQAAARALNARRLG
nr:hypothetical protein [Acetobacter okinawensis]